MTPIKDYYAIMGVAKNATPQDIKMAYRRLARQYHPDVSQSPDAEEKFKELGQAYDVLKDPKKREAYDKFGDQWAQAGQSQPSEGAQPQDGPSYHFTEELDDEWLESLFGFKRSQAYQQRGARPGQDYYAHLNLTLEEAFRGGTRQLDIPGPKDSKQTLMVKIPAGVREGQKIRLAGQGGLGMGEGARGDLYLTVHLAPHPIFTLKQQDVYLTLPITPWEAALGARVKIPTLSGVVELKIPASSQTDQTLRLAGKGFPGQNERETSGNQYVVLKIMTPQALNDEQKQYYERMAQVMPFNPRQHLGV
jgi:curved DNA-binding protein